MTLIKMFNKRSIFVFDLVPLMQQLSFLQNNSSGRDFVGFHWKLLISLSYALDKLVDQAVPVASRVLVIMHLSLASLWIDPQYTAGEFFLVTNKNLSKP